MQNYTTPPCACLHGMHRDFTCATFLIFTLLNTCPQDAKQALRGCRGIAQPILNLGSKRGWVVIATPWPLYPWDSDPIDLVQKAGRAWGRVWKVTLLNTRKTGFICVLWMSITSLFIHKYSFCTKINFSESWQTWISIHHIWLPQIVCFAIGTTIYNDRAKKSQCHRCGLWLAQPDGQSSKCFQGHNLQSYNKIKHFNIELLHPCTYEGVLI